MIRIVLYTAARQAVCGASALLALFGGWALCLACGVVAAPGEVPGPVLATWLDLAILAGPAIVPLAAVVAIAWHAGELRSRACGAEREAVTTLGLGGGTLVAGLLLPWLPWFVGLDGWARDGAPDAAARLTDHWVAALAADPQQALSAVAPGDRIAVGADPGGAGGRALLPVSDDDCLGVAWRTLSAETDDSPGRVARLRFADVSIVGPGHRAGSVEQAVLRMPRTARVLAERSPAEVGASSWRRVGERWRRARLASGDPLAPARLRALRGQRALLLPVTVLASVLVAALGLAGRRAVAWPAWSAGLAGVAVVVALPRVLVGWWTGAAG